MPDHPTPGTSDASCIFCKIIAGQIPCHKLYEGDRVLAFLDIGPLSKGHALVIPKEHYRTIDEVPPEIAAAMGRIIPGLSKAIMQATGATSWNLLQNNGEDAGQDVLHVHLHIIPRKPGTDRKHSAAGDGLAATPWRSTTIDHAEAGKLAEQIRSAIA